MAEVMAASMAEVVVAAVASPPSSSGLSPHDLDAKCYNNLRIEVFLVIPGKPHAISAHLFFVSANHKSNCTTIKQTIYNILINSLSPFSASTMN